ncbi:hypothetical protein MSG28_010027 [Choristoneura fumiferana]|uniref:Uncharacterized protein n=2 Tax=Choristoneura fumiferana TaxID=7141 RepID=A0ACC0KJ58_CHOFU|nr:hypothetical protein MSG28_010027 [Choristoneura fumiferana]KAI8436453.1 hypothetical protein MSG28_010027 [Choristoneura fumiferana]
MELESQALALPMPRGEDAEMPDSLTLALAIDSSPPTSLPTDYDVSSPEWSVQLHQAADDSIPVNESIISLLLKLHSQLSGRLDSFSLDEPEPQSDEPIGDGPHFIGQVLRKLARLDARCAAAIDHKEERSRRARERQQQLMKEFQRRQQQFLHCMQRLSPEPMELDAPAPAPAPAPADYDCVICNTSSSTSVLGHRRRAGSGTASLALSERDRARLAEQRETTAASHYYRLHDDLQQNFDQESWLLSVSVGLEGGVHVASCGHHLHLRCLHAYLRSLAAPARPHNLHVAGGEFLCPVCRYTVVRGGGGGHVASAGHHLHLRCLHAYLRSLAAPARPHNLHVAGGEFLCPVCRYTVVREGGARGVGRPPPAPALSARVPALAGGARAAAQPARGRRGVPVPRVQVHCSTGGGGHVASAGHHLHLRCLHAYLRSLAAPARPHNLHVAGGEFLCPVCSTGGGGHVASAGHHLHLRCLHAYLRSLAAPARPHNLHVAGGEFLCPVCRYTVVREGGGGGHVASAGHHLHLRCLHAYLRSLAAPARRTTCTWPAGVPVPRVQVHCSTGGGGHVASAGHHLHLRCLHAYLRSLAAPARPHNLHVAGGEFLCPVCRYTVVREGGGGGHVASAGHHLHLRCLHAYLRSLAAPARPHNLHVAGGEFLCPVCRYTVVREGGHVASAGHHLHLRCLHAYLRSLAAPARPHNLHVAGGEFLCPVCRGGHVASAGHHLHLRCLHAYLRSLAAPARPHNLHVAGGSSCARVQYGRGGHVASAGHPLHLRCLHAYLRSLAAPARPHNLHVAGGEFLCPSPSALSDAMNKAMEDMTETASSKLRQRYGSSPGAIFTFVTSLVRTNLECELVQRGGSLLTQEPPAAPQEPRPRYKPRNDCIVPLMVVAGAHAHVLSAAGALGVADTCAPRAECGSPAPPVPAPPAPVARPVPLLLRDPLALLLHLLLLAPAQPPHLQPQHFACIVHALYALSYYQIVQELLLPYLRVCALLRHHVYGAALPELPALLRLPRDYDRLFSYYHERVCLQCGAVPKEASVCLLCGTLVCLKQACCRSHQQAEAVQHANDCGGGTGIFLVVTSTYIIVIRGRRACLWGSLYLDDYDEEDRDLKRGKPLYLSGDRAELLQAQWLAHRFDHTKRTWVLGLYSFRCDAESGSEISIYTDDEFINTLSKPCFIHSKGKIIVFYTFRTIEQCYNIDYDYDYEFYKVSKVTPIFKFSYNKPCYETYLYTVYLL